MWCVCNDTSESAAACKAENVPVVDVIVLSSPAPIVVGKAVDLQVLLFTQRGDASKILIVR